MALPPLNNLNPVFKISQEYVRLSKSPGIFVFDIFFLCKCLDGVEGVLLAYMAILPPVNELEGLDEELDLPYAPHPQLDISPLPSLAQKAQIDPLLHRPYLFDSGKVEMSPVNKGLNGREELLSEGNTPRYRAGLDHGRPLPALPPRFVIYLRAPERVCYGPPCPFRSQIKIDPEDITVLGDGADHLSYHLGEADKEGVEINSAITQAIGARCLTLIGGVKVDDIDIGVEVELSTTELPHA